MGSIAVAPQQAPSRPGAGATLADIFDYQRRMVDTNNFEFLGRMKRIVLEAEENARTQPQNVTDKLGHVLEWYNQPHPKGGVVQNYLPIGQTYDRKMLLALEYAMTRDLNGRLTPEVGLPYMPDPSWKPQNPVSTEQAEEWAAEAAQGLRTIGGPPMIPQNLNQLTNKMIQGTQFLVFQPIAQVLVQLAIGGELRAEYATIKMQFDPATRTWPAFLIDRQTGEAHFYGGRYELIRV